MRDYDAKIAKMYDHWKIWSEAVKNWGAKNSEMSIEQRKLRHTGKSECDFAKTFKSNTSLELRSVLHTYEASAVCSETSGCSMSTSRRARAPLPLRLKRVKHLPRHDAEWRSTHLHCINYLRWTAARLLNGVWLKNVSCGAEGRGTGGTYWLKNLTREGFEVGWQKTIKELNQKKIRTCTKKAEQQTGAWFEHNIEGEPRLQNQIRLH